MMMEVVDCTGGSDWGWLMMMVLDSAGGDELGYKW